MPDNLSKTGTIDDTRIDIENDSAIRFWKTALDCTEEQLLEAIAEVGSLVTAVRTHLRGTET
jgi:hypothetical protein